MKTFTMIAGITALLAGAVTSPVWAQQTASERADLARYQKYAQAPVDHVHYFQVEGFKYLAPDKVAIWFGVNKLYLLTVQTPCNNLSLANGIGLTSNGNMLYSRLDAVTFDHQRCTITRIVPVDELKMKQDARKAKAAASASTG